MWVARYCRNDVWLVVNPLTTKVSKWTALEDDKSLPFLSCLYHSRGSRKVGLVRETHVFAGSEGEHRVVPGRKHVHVTLRLEHESAPVDLSMTLAAMYIPDVASDWEPASALEMPERLATAVLEKLGLATEWAHVPLEG